MSKSKMQNKGVATLSRVPMRRWEAAADRMGTDARMRLGDRAAALAEHFARLSAYLSRRGSGGKHGDAVKHQNQAANRVRAALGYAYKSVVTF